MLTAEQEKMLVELGFTHHDVYYDTLIQRYRGINGTLKIVISPRKWEIFGFGPYPEDMRKDLAILREKGIV